MFDNKKINRKNKQNNMMLKNKAFQQIKDPYIRQKNETLFSPLGWRKIRF